MKQQPGPAIPLFRIKSAWIKYFPAILGILFFISCKDNTKAPATGSHPVFESDPQLRKLTEEIKQSPKDASLYFERGQLLHKLRQDTLAISDYKTASSLDTNRAEYYSAVGDLLFDNKDLSGSVPWIQKAIAKNPTDRKAHLKGAKLFLYLKDYAKAFAEINIVLRNDPHDPEAYFLKGMIYKDVRDTVKAVSSFLTAVEVAPDYKDAVVQLGLLYSSKKDPIALKYLENAYRMDTLDVFPIYAMGVYYQDANEFEKAKDQYRRCINNDWHYADAYFNMGYILLQQDSVEKAFRQYDLITKIDPQNPAAYFNRGLCREIMDSIPQAAKDYQLAMSLDPEYRSPREALQRLKANNKKK